MTHSQQILDRYRAALIPVFGVPQTVLSHGDGCYVVDVDGKRYLDLLGGIAVNTLGHGHPALVEAITKQAEPGRPHLQLLHLRAAGRAGREAPRGMPRARRFRGVLRQLRGGGPRGRGQVDPPHRSHADHRRPERLSRTHHRCSRPDVEGGLPRAVRTPDARCHPRPLQRRGRAEGGGGRRRRRPRRRGPRTHPGRGRRPGRHRRIPAAGPRPDPRRRRPSRPRRGPVGDGSDGPLAGPPRDRCRSRRGDAGQGAGRGSADRRAHHLRTRRHRPAHRRAARLDLRRQPARVRRRAGRRATPSSRTGCSSTRTSSAHTSRRR